MLVHDVLKGQNKFLLPYSVGFRNLDLLHKSTFISLQQACGFEYTSKLQRMFQDVGVSKDLNEHFRKHLAHSNDSLDSKLNIYLCFWESSLSSNGFHYVLGYAGFWISYRNIFLLVVDFSIQVLSSGSWPFQQSCSFVLPHEVIFLTTIYFDFSLISWMEINDEIVYNNIQRNTLYFFQLERSFQRFTTFYSGQHSGRKLNWLYQMSKGEIVTNCFKNRYTLQVRRVKLNLGHIKREI